MLHGEEAVVFADSGYRGITKREEIQAQHPGVDWQVAMMSGKRRALKKSKTVDALIDKLEKIGPDEVARLIAPTPDALIKLQVQVPLQLERDAHIVVMGFGRRALPRGLAQFDPHAVPRFVTNAIFVDADHDGVWAPPGGKTCTYVLPD